MLTTDKNEAEATLNRISDEWDIEEVDIYD